MTSESDSDGGLTISDSESGFGAEGYTAQLAPVDSAMVRCFACHTDSPAGAFKVDAMDRTEGASDPDDMLAIVATTCPNCGAKGTLELKYGPEAALVDQQVLKALEDVPRL